MIERISISLIRLLSQLLQLLPHDLALSLARGLGFILSKCYYRRRIAYANLKAAFGDRYDAEGRKKIVEKHFLNLAQIVVEVLRFPKLDQKYFERYISAVNRDRYESQAKGPKGTILITPHFGNWELTQILSGLIGRPLHVLARQQKHSLIDDFLNELRASHGSIPIHKGGQVRELIKVLRQGGMVGVLGDLSGGREGTVVNFFGRKTTAPTGIFEIAERTESDILPCFMVRLDKGYHQIFLDDIFKLVKKEDGTADIPGSVQSYYRLLEHWIEKHPEQWFWMYKRWKLCFTKKILVLKDGRAGHENQSEAVINEIMNLKQSLLPEYEFGVQRIHVRFKSAFRQKLFYTFSILIYPFIQGRLNLLQWFLQKECAEELEKAYADVIVSAGSSLVPVNLLLKRENMAKSILNMKPSFPFDPKFFDLLIVPAHDKMSDFPNAIRTLIAPNLVDEELLAKSAQKLLKKAAISLNGSKRMSVFIGGQTKTYQFESQDLSSWLASLKESADQLNYELLITTSRRTDPETSHLIKEHFSNHPRTKLLIVANESNVEQAAYGMLGLSEVAVVTEDSVSMISEAVSAGKKVLVMQLGNGKLPEKHSRFHQLLAEKGLIQIANAENFQSKLLSLNGKSAKDVMKEQSEEIQEAIRKLV